MKIFNETQAPFEYDDLPDCNNFISISLPEIANFVHEIHNYCIIQALSDHQKYERKLGIISDEELVLASEMLEENNVCDSKENETVAKVIEDF